MMTPRTAQRWARERPVTRYCQRPGCGAATRLGKPFCSEHVDDHPYVRDLLGLMEDMASEEASVRERGTRAVDAESLVSQEILRFLRVHGERTIPRLARDLNMDVPTLESYAAALDRRGAVQLGENKRGATMIRIPLEPAPKPRRRRRSSREPGHEVGEGTAAETAAETGGDARDAIETAT